MIISNVVLFIIMFLGVLVYFLTKREVNRKMFHIFVGMLGVVLSFGSCVLLIGLNVPQKGIVYMDGGIKSGSEIFENAGSDNLNLVYVSTVGVQNLFERMYYHLLESNKHPEFKGREKNILSGGSSGFISSSLLLESKHKSYISAYRHNGETIPYDKYLQVESVFTNSILDTASGLKTGDIIKKVNGNSINDRDDLWAYANEEKELTLEVTSEGETNIITFETNKYGRDHLKLGFWVSEQFEYEVPKNAPKLIEGHIDSGDSSGLLMAIQIYYKISKKNFGKDVKVLVSGSIDEYGRVGAVGSVKHKVNTAIKENADILMVPRSNVIEALFQQQQMEDDSVHIIGISTLDEAITFLEIH